MTSGEVWRIVFSTRLLGTLILWWVESNCLAFDVPPARPPDLVISGGLTGADHRSVRREPFMVPAGVTTLAVRFDYDGKAERTVIDLGIDDPHGFRGWSGGNKTYFEVGRLQATPSYLPGPLDPGRWHLVLSVPNIRPDSVARYRAEVWFLGIGEGARVPTVLRSQPGWYRGDLHMHTGHSDARAAAWLVVVCLARCTGWHSVHPKKAWTSSP